MSRPLVSYVLRFLKLLNGKQKPSIMPEPIATEDIGGIALSIYIVRILKLTRPNMFRRFGHVKFEALAAVAAQNPASNATFLVNSATLARTATKPDGLSLSHCNYLVIGAQTAELHEIPRLGECFLSRYDPMDEVRSGPATSKFSWNTNPIINEIISRLIGKVYD